MKRLLIPIFLLLTTFIQAQHHEIGFWGGTAFYSGDLTPPKQVLYELNIAAGLSYQYQFNSFVGLRIGGAFGQISGSDHHASENSQRKIRNLSFRSNIYEASLSTTINLLPFAPSKETRPFAPYLFVGVAGFYFNPKARFNSQWIELQPLGTEGQGTLEFPDRKKYKRLQIAIPFGLGFKFSLGKHISFSIEAGLRKTFTDYLDDVSTTYVSLSSLSDQNGSLAAALSNRTYDIEGNQIDQSGSNRGGNQIDNLNGAKQADWYSTIGLGLSFNLGVKEKTTKDPDVELHKWM